MLDNFLDLCFFYVIMRKEYTYLKHCNIKIFYLYNQLKLCIKMFSGPIQPKYILIISSVLISLVIYSCAAGYSKKELDKFNQNLAEKLKKCDQEKLSGYIVTNMQYAECQNKVFKNACMEIDYPYMDLVDLLNAYRLYLAENLDKGAISDAESKLSYEEYRQKVVAEENARLQQANEQRRRAWKEFGESLDNAEIRW